jgi:serine/threonine protein phosphatase 1
MIWPFKRKPTATPASQKAAPPDSSPRRFVIPDIHGCALTLEALVEEVISLGKEDDLYLLGDYIDRGPRSREALDFIMKLIEEGYRVFPLRGNHEEMFLNACTDRDHYRIWILNGGYAALDSFGVEDACEVPISYRRFCSELPYYHLLDDYLLVHAGFNFEAEDPYADTQSLLWDRTRSVNRELLGGRTMVCGHTPHHLRHIERMLKRDHGLIILDNGCFLAGRKGMGSLLALELNSRTLFSQANIDIAVR